MVDKKSPKGVLALAGGAIDINKKDDGTCKGGDVFRHIVSRLPETTASKVVILPTASQLEPMDAAEGVVNALAAIGVDMKNINVLDVKNNPAKYDGPANLVKSDNADHPENLAALKQADLVFFTGGDQNLLTKNFAGTEFLSTLKERYNNEAGFTISGTSAGAAVMSKTMISEGGNKERFHEPGYIKTAEGFGLVDTVIMDTHCRQRGRPERGKVMLARPENKGLGYIGLDENTAIWLENGKMTAFGENAVTILSPAPLIETKTLYASDSSSMPTSHDYKKAKATAKILNNKEKTRAKMTKPDNLAVMALKNMARE